MVSSATNINCMDIIQGVLKMSHSGKPLQIVGLSNVKLFEHESLLCKDINEIYAWLSLTVRIRKISLTKIRMKIA